MLNQRYDSHTLKRIHSIPAKAKWTNNEQNRKKNNEYCIQTALTYRIPVHLITRWFHFRSFSFHCIIFSLHVSCLIFVPFRYGLYSLWFLLYFFLLNFWCVCVDFFSLIRQFLIEFCVGSAFTLMKTIHVLRAFFVYSNLDSKRCRSAQNIIHLNSFAIRTEHIVFIRFIQTLSIFVQFHKKNYIWSASMTNVRKMGICYAMLHITVCLCFTVKQLI